MSKLNNLISNVQIIFGNHNSSFECIKISNKIRNLKTQSEPLNIELNETAERQVIEVSSVRVCQNQRTMAFFVTGELLRHLKRLMYLKLLGVELCKSKVVIDMGRLARFVFDCLYPEEIGPSARSRF